MSENQVGWAGEVSAIETKLKQKGMKNRSPMAPSDRLPKGSSVNEGTTRSDTARSHSLGPREA